jgi:hypothetical protein
MTDDELDELIAAKVDEHTSSKPPRVTLDKGEIEDYALRWACEEDTELKAEVNAELAELDLGDIMAVLKRGSEVANEMYETTQHILKVHTQ